MDTIRIQPLGDLATFDTGIFDIIANPEMVPTWELGFRLAFNTVNIGMEVRTSAGSILLEWIVTDSLGGTQSQSKINNVTTQWTKWTGADEFTLDCSSLTKGSAIVTLELCGIGYYKDLYIYQN